MTAGMKVAVAIGTAIALIPFGFIIWVITQAVTSEFDTDDEQED